MERGRFTDGSRYADRHLRGGAVLIVTLLLAIAPGSSAQIPDWRAAPQTDALEFGSPRLETGFGLDLDDGEWASSLTLTQFNSWNVSWHTAAVHRELGNGRHPVLSEELRLIERNFPGDPVWHIDVEGWRSDLIVSRGVGDFTVSAQIPWIEIGSPNWDKLAEGFHSTLRINRLKRDQFPRSETLIYLKSEGNGSIIEAGVELERYGTGDVTLAAGRPLARRWGGSHQIVATVQIPTGREGTLQGSGGWDLGIAWYGTWKKWVSTFKAGAGYTWLDPSGSFMALERSRYLGHLLFEVDRPLWFGFQGSAGIRLDSSPLLKIMKAYPGYPATFYRFSLLREIGPGWISLTIGNALLPQTGDEADYTFGITTGWTRAAD